MRHVLVIAALGACDGRAREAPLDACVAAEAPTAIARMPADVCVPASPALLDSECCVARRAPAQEARTVIDLRTCGVPATAACGTYGSPGWTGYHLPRDRAAYPVKILLPQLAGIDAACADVCQRRLGKYGPTAWGVGVEADFSFLGPDHDDVMAIHVPPPWKMVSGGKGEAYPYPCLEGYQEFGRPRSCTTIRYGGFGFATDDPHAPEAEAIIELVSWPHPIEDLGETNCCLYE